MKATAFRIKDFRSIIDSGECPLSGDGITVLAGQNESGKTAVLSALRDFDLEPGDKPQTADYLPENKVGAKPEVHVKFEFVPDLFLNLCDQNDLVLPDRVRGLVAAERAIWVIRDLPTGTYRFEDRIMAEWDAALVAATQGPAEAVTNAEKADVGEDDTKEELDPEDAPQELRLLDADVTIAELRPFWPAFIYFDSFEDTLPREVALTLLSPAKGQNGLHASAPSAVRDFISLSKLDVALVNTYASDNKSLGNYLRSVGASITGDFLTYWKQTTAGNDTVDLHVRHHRDESGTLKLAFFVHDAVDQYPDQRSKGFLWFLSFYLRLAAAHSREGDPDRVLLIDEPGTYLHARAQKDVLHLFEDRLAQRNTIIYSTHSLFLMPADRLHRLRLVIKSRKGGTRVLDRLTHPDLRGEGFADTMSPVLASIGLDIREQLTFARQQNVIVEGISDHFYLTSWAKLVKPEFNETINVFPGSGATTVPVLASLFIGWGLAFGALLDRDENGNQARDKLIRDFSLEKRRVIQPQDGTDIEDLFSAEDFKGLLAKYDSKLMLEAGERPSVAIRRQRIDKVLLARTFAEEVTAGRVQLTKKTKDAIERLLSALVIAAALAA